MGSVEAFGRKVRAFVNGIQTLVEFYEYIFSTVPPGAAFYSSFVICPFFF